MTTVDDLLVSESQDARYDEYADIFGNPVTAESIELGNRVLHWVFMENYAQYVAQGVIKQQAREAQRIARERAR
jgi:hypothetical protein